MASERTERTIELELGHGVPVDVTQLAKATEHFAAGIREVARAYTGVDKGVRWLVEVQPGSVRLPVMPEAVGERVRPSAAAELPELIAEGLAQLEREAVRPSYFPDRALEEFRDLARLAKEDFPVRVRNGHGYMPLTPRAVANITQILGRRRVSVGTVEGRLESLSVHGTRDEFTIWPTKGTSVRCTFGEHVQLDEVLPAVGRRVSARGRIRTKPDGTRESLQVYSLRVLGQAPIDPEAVRGIVEGREVDEW